MEISLSSILEKFTGMPLEEHRNLGPPPKGNVNKTYGFSDGGDWFFRVRVPSSMNPYFLLSRLILTLKLREIINSVQVDLLPSGAYYEIAPFVEPRASGPVRHTRRLRSCNPSGILWSSARSPCTVA
jgi:hypothetical protein